MGGRPWGCAIGKLVRPLLIVAAIAVHVIPGIGQVLSATIIAGITSAGIGAGLSIASSIASSAFSSKPKVPKASTDRLQANIDPRAPRKMAFGETALATDIRDQEFTGSDQEYFHRFMINASHKVTSIDRIWFDDKLAWSASGGVTSDFAGYLTVDTVLEGSGANAINISSRMGSTRRFTGCAYVHFRYKLTGTKKAESPFAQSVPTRITIIGKGCPVYDARFDSTVPGGSGTMRAEDQSTWAFTYGGVDCGTNPAAQLLTWLLGWRIRNPVTGAMKLAVGKGVPPERIDMVSFINGANLCDEAVTLAAGGTEPRYRSAGVIGEDENAFDVIDTFKGVMNALFDDADGQLRLLVMHNDLSDPSIPLFTDIDVLGAFQWNPSAPLDQDYNVVRGSYTDPSDTSLYQLVPYPDVSLASVDDIPERSDPVDFAFCESASQAQRLAKQRLERAQYPGTFSAEFDATAWQLIKGDVIKLTFGALAFTQKLFRVMEATAQVNGRVPMVLREEHASIYAWDADERPAVVAASPTVYLWQNNPLLQGLADVTNSILVEWSPDGLTSWGSFTAGDRWMRVSTDGGASWSAAALAIGEDGYGTRHVFKRAASVPATPTGDGVPTGWSDGPPVGTDPLWLATTIQDASGVSQTAWSVPIRLDGPAGAPGDAGVSPIAVSAQPESFTIQLDADGSVTSGQLPFVIANSAIQGGAAVTVTGVTVTATDGCAATASGTSGVSVNTISAVNGSVSYDVDAGGQTVSKTVAFATSREGGSGSVSQTMGVNVASVPLTWGTYQQHGGTLAINASATGNLSVNLTGAMKCALGDGMQFTSKIIYSTNGGSSWSDVAGSEHLSTLSEELTDPSRQTNANVNGSGPYSLTGLGDSTPVLLQIQDKRTGDDAVSGALSLYAEQV